VTVEVLMPKLGFSMNEGQVIEWLAADGQTVTEGQLLFVMETEKSASEIEAPASGVLRILKPIQEVFEVGTLLATIE
jgi:pyruvate/2-oxoglutarate dehydrogenase complex dihydrolipoamide acyltransferase (E2) component